MERRIFVPIRRAWTTRRAERHEYGLEGYLSKRLARCVEKSLTKCLTKGLPGRMSGVNSYL
jgi:hypothetical protein